MESLNHVPPGENFPHNQEEPDIKTYDAEEEDEEEDPKDNFAARLRRENEIELEDADEDDADDPTLKLSPDKTPITPL